MSAYRGGDLKRQGTLIRVLIFALLAGLAFLAARRLRVVKDGEGPPPGLAGSSTKVGVVVPRGDVSELEESTIQVFERSSPSVVSVANKAVRRDYFTLQVLEIPQGAGSGFVWDREGHIISNYHVVHGGQAFDVQFNDGSIFDAEVVGAAPDYDLAVLRVRVPREKLVPVLPGTSRQLRVGQRVLAIGNPFGLENSLSVGIVSSLGRTIKSLTGRTIHDMIQTDAAINSGNSGGPLLDSSGRLIGINTAIVSPSGGSVGIGFAVPVDTVIRVVPQLIEYGRVKRIGLGVTLLPDRFAYRSGIDGVAVMQVLPGSAAARAGIAGMRRGWGGIELGDIIVGAAGQKIESTDDLFQVIDGHTEGDELELVLESDGRRRRVKVALQALD